MSEREYLAKTKEDLINLVRISGVMQISKARQMRKADLARHLAKLDAEAAEEKKQERIETRAQQNRKSRSGSQKPRRSVFEVVVPEEEETKETAQEPTDQVSEDRASQRGRRTTQSKSSGGSRSHRSKMLPYPLDSDDETGSEEDSDDESAEAVREGYRELQQILLKDDEDAEGAENEGSERKTQAKQSSGRQRGRSSKSRASEGNNQKTKPAVRVKDHRKRQEEQEDDGDDSSDAGSDVDRSEARPRPAGGHKPRQMSSKGRKQDRREKTDKQDQRDQRQSKQERQSQEAKSDAKQQDDRGKDKEQDNSKQRQQRQQQEVVSGVLEIMPDNYGFLRLENYIQNPSDAYVPPQLIRRFNLRNGDLVTGAVREQRDQDRYRAVTFINEVNGMSPEKMIRRPHFERLTPIYPLERFTLETVKNEFSTRIIDLFAPIGKGQRGMIVSPPKAGKTILLQKVANALAANNPEAKLLVLLIDERPEEVTDMQRLIKGEVVYSTFDKTPDNHVRITELVLDRAKRMVELGEDVVILLDSMTRMARAYNSTINPTGRTLSGGLDPGALYGPKRFFGAARNIENGGSLTIVATSLVETGSRMDEVIFEEFKGTGNMEVVLDRKLADRRIFPAIDINRSGTRREELLLTRKELESVWGVRKAFGHMDNVNVTEMVLNLLRKTADNEHFIGTINQTLMDKGALDTVSQRR